MNLDFWPFSYFRRKSEERRNKLKEEILAELSPQIKLLLDEHGKSVKEEGKRLVREFSREIKDDKKSIESQIKELFEEFRGVKSQSENVSGVASAVKKDSERIKAYAEEAKTKADGAVSKVQSVDSLVQRAGELCDKIDARLKDYTDKAVSAAVEKCTATVAGELQKAVQAAREEYRMNIEDHTDNLDRRNTEKIKEVSKKLECSIKENLESFKKECQAVIDALKKNCSAELEAFKKNYTAAQEDYQKVMPRLDAAAQRFKILEEKIIKLEDAMHGRPQYLVTAYLLTSLQRKQLRELYSPEFKGDAARYKRHLEELRDRQLKGKKNLTPAELEIDFAPRELDSLLKSIAHYNRDEVYELLDVVDLLAGIKRSNQAGSSRPGSGRHNRH
ncbi:MAG: hypothetical protein QW666_03690 [Candidatus Woesearchaeota archaeon]